MGTCKDMNQINMYVWRIEVKWETFHLCPY